MKARLGLKVRLGFRIPVERGFASSGNSSSPLRPPALGRADAPGFEPVAAVRAVPANLMMAATWEWSLARLALQSEPARSAQDADVDARLLRGLADSMLEMQELQPPEQSVSLRVSWRE